MRRTVLIINETQLRDAFDPKNPNRVLENDVVIIARLIRLTQDLIITTPVDILFTNHAQLIIAPHSLRMTWTESKR